MDPYEELNLKEDCSVEDVKLAYRTMSKNIILMLTMVMGGNS